MKLFRSFVLAFVICCAGAAQAGGENCRFSTDPCPGQLTVFTGGPGSCETQCVPDDPQCQNLKCRPSPGCRVPGTACILLCVYSPNPSCDFGAL